MYASRMHDSNLKPKLTVIWEPVINPDPEAIHKAFAMLFRHGTLEEESAQTRGNAMTLTNPADLVTFPR